MDLFQEHEENETVLLTFGAQVLTLGPWDKSSMLGDIDTLLHHYLNCPMCESRLRFNVQTRYAHGVCEESVDCPECGLKVRKLMHAIQ